MRRLDKPEASPWPQPRSQWKTKPSPALPRKSHYASNKPVYTLLVYVWSHQSWYPNQLRKGVDPATAMHITPLLVDFQELPHCPLNCIETIYHSRRFIFLVLCSTILLCKYYTPNVTVPREHLVFKCLHSLCLCYSLWPEFSLLPIISLCLFFKIIIKANSSMNSFWIILTRQHLSLLWTSHHLVWISGGVYHVLC